LETAAIGCLNAWLSAFSIQLSAREKGLSPDPLLVLKLNADG